MSKIINLEIVDIFEGIAVLETESGFEVELELDSLPSNVKVGQTIKCAMTLDTNTTHKQVSLIVQEDYSKKSLGSKLLSY